ncbi:hypothetical protein N9969_01195 [Akkermansiaceae bacterium]|nr:hypothetical protein [bacterium]MDB4332299.1 hypothetical protein [Akkermansiaceae bacterium]
MLPFITFMRLFFLLALIGSLHARTIELRFPDLAFPVQVSLPDNFDPAKKHPAILYYHGTNGRPDTKLMRRETGQNDWIVVGMSYFQKGQLKLAPESFKKEITLYHSVRQYLLGKYALDPKRLYVSGFSKGGWMTDLLLQQEKTLAGGAILGAGHLHKAARPQTRYSFKKPIFIGVGRLDGNYPFALKALLHHRSLGGAPIMETWSNLAHEYPQDGATGLRQWLAIQGNSSSNAKKEMVTAISVGKSLTPLGQWNQLRHLKELPYAKIFGESEIDAWIAALEKDEFIQKEAAALKEHRRILAKEVTGTSLKSLQAVNFSYLDLADRFKKTQQSKLLLHDHERTSTLLKHFVEQEKMTPNRPAPIDTPESPASERRIPGNPLIR